MTPTQQRDISLRFRRFVLRYEPIHARIVQAALREQIAQYTSTGTLMAVNSTPIYPVLVNIYKTSAKIWGHQSALQVRRHKGMAPLGFSERIVELMRQYYGIDLLNVAEGLTETTKRVIQGVLDEAALLGWSFNEIVKKLEAPELTRARARLIARTETVSAANGAAVINAKETAAKTGLVLNKIWIAARDNRTRPDHKEVDGQIVGIDDMFIVGGFAMSQPGDRRHGASAAEIVNCRCAVAFIPVG